jgi:hypothetical protein
MMKEKAQAEAELEAIQQRHDEAAQQQAEAEAFIAANEPLLAEPEGTAMDQLHQMKGALRPRPRSVCLTPAQTSSLCSSGSHRGSWRRRSRTTFAPCTTTSTAFRSPSVTAGRTSRASTSSGSLTRLRTSGAIGTLASTSS